MDAKNTLSLHDIAEFVAELWDAVARVQGPLVRKIPPEAGAVVTYCVGKAIADRYETAARAKVIDTEAWEAVEKLIAAFRRVTHEPDPEAKA